MLKVDDLHVFYGNAQALAAISIGVDEGEIVTLIGSNGAGKTTFMMALSGVVKPKSGTIEFLNTKIDGLEPHLIVKLGLVHVTQAKNLFPEMTVRENLELGAYGIKGAEVKRKKLDGVYELFRVLYERREQKAVLLSGGEQQMLAFGRALMSDARLMLLDEPSAGLAPIIVKELGKTIEDFRQHRGLTILLVEQNAELALTLADRGYVLESGVLVTQGTSVELFNSDKVKRAYIGM
jgi:branched-chain amino acid transport system ATP-binding protein